jgi:hypothetical protein
MQELIKKLLAALPLYCRQMLALLSGPRTAILQQDLDSDSALEQALTFIAVSFGIAYIGQIPLLPGGHSTAETFGILAVGLAFAFGLNVILVILAWRIVGGRLAGKKILIVTCYFCGVSTILCLAISLLALGTFKVMDPSLYQQYLSGTFDDPSNSLKNGGYVAFLVLMGIAVVVVYAWIFWIWGAYRQLMQLSRMRSGIAFFLFTTFSPLLFLVQFLMTAPILMPRTTPPMPDDLKGRWQSTGPTDAIGIIGNGNVTYNFYAPWLRIIPNGEYKMEAYERHAVSNATCTVDVLRTEWGWATAHDSNLVLSPFYGGQTTADHCAGTNVYAPTKPATAKYQYQIIQAPSGWTLHLSNRLGGANFIPKNP